MDGTHLHSLYEFLSIDSMNSVFLDHFSSKYTVVMSVQCNPPLQRHYAPAYATQRQSIHSTVSCQYGIVKTDLLVRVIAIHPPRVTKMYHLHVSGMCQFLCGYHDLLLIFFKHTKNDEKQKSKKHVLKCFKYIHIYIYIRSVTQCNLQAYKSQKVVTAPRPCFGHASPEVQSNVARPPPALQRFSATTLKRT